jgi:hypothetical protein
LGYEPNELPGCSTPRHNALLELGEDSLLDGLKSNVKSANRYGVLFH